MATGEIKVGYLVTYTITFEGEAKSKSEEWCDYLAIALDSDFGQEVLDKYGMGFMDYQAIPRINLNINGNTAFINDTISLTISTTRMEDFPIGHINRVQATGDLDLGNNPDIEVDVNGNG